MAAEKRDDERPSAAPEVGDEYSTVELEISWGLASILVFALILPMRQILGWLPWHPANAYAKPLLAALSVPVLGLTGLVLGLIGLRWGRRRGLAKVGIFLNAIAVGSAILLIAAFLYIRLLR